MKNLIIGALGAVIVSGMDFWIYEDLFDRFLIGITIFAIITVFLFVLDEWFYDRRIKKRRAEEFGRFLDEMQNRP